MPYPWFNTYLFAKSNWKQIESILISISKSWKGWTHVAYYYKHSKSLGDIFCGCDMIPLHKRRSGVNFLNQMMTCRFSSQLRKKELILPIGIMMMMMLIPINIIIMVVTDTDTLERFSLLMIITCHEEKESFCIWVIIACGAPKFEKYLDIHHGRHCHLIITRKFQGSETQGLCHFYRYQANWQDWNFRWQYLEKQARKPRSYASSKLWPIDSLTG